MERAFQLIGAFMSDWSELESHLNDAVAALLEIDDLVLATALAVNMGCRDKLNLVRTLLDLEFTSDSERGKAAHKLLNKIGDRNGDRNLVAHTPFISKPNGVLFHVVKAKGKLAIPNVLWTADDFTAKRWEMFALGRELKATVALALETRKSDSPPNALSLVPTGGTHEPRSLGLQMTRPQDVPDSPPATPETEPQSCPDREG